MIVTNHLKHPTQIAMWKRILLNKLRLQSLFGLAPSGVYPAIPVTSNAVRSYRHLFTLTIIYGTHSIWRYIFCGTFPKVALARGYLALCFHGARTFLSSKTKFLSSDYPALSLLIFYKN